MATKASPVKVSFEFDCAEFFTHEGAKDSGTVAQIRLVHSAIRPGVTHADIARKLNEFRPDGVSPMDISHYAQTASLAIGAMTTLTSVHYSTDADLIALYKARTTGTKGERDAMVAAFEGDPSTFPAYVLAWRRATNAAKSAARTASADKSTAKGTDAPRKNGGADAPTDKGVSTPVNLASVKFGDLLAEMNRRIVAAESDKARAEMVKGLKILLQKSVTPATPATIVTDMLASGEDGATISAAAKVLATA